MTELAAMLPTTARVRVAVYSLCGVALVSAALAGAQYGSHDTVTVKTKHVEKSWGKPSTSVDGSQVNPQLAGMTCDVYRSKQTVVCHP